VHSNCFITFSNSHDYGHVYCFSLVHKTTIGLKFVVSVFIICTGFSSQNFKNKPFGYHSIGYMIYLWKLVDVGVYNLTFFNI
jgi:hypothetical protein